MPQTAADLHSDRRAKLLGAYSRALLGVELAYHSAAGETGQPAHRASFYAQQVSLPITPPTLADECGERFYLAVAAHVSAHAQFSPPARATDGRKPLQLVVRALIEDARVEHLAMVRLPGLKRLWAPYYQAIATEGGVTAAALLAKLSYALFDPDERHVDDDAPWLEKGRALFFADPERLSDPSLSDDIGDRLANDLGQLRLAFDAPSYQVEPPYRDDHSGLWQLDSDQQLDQQMTQRPLTAALQTEHEPSQTPGHDQPAAASQPTNTDANTDNTDNSVEELSPAAVYPEWDYRSRRLREQWATLLTQAPPVATGNAGYQARARLNADYPRLQRRLQTLIRKVRLGQQTRLLRQADGEQLDLDACIKSQVERRAGQTADGRVYASKVRRQRDLALLLLLDRSRSTGDRLTHDRSILELAKDATLLLGDAVTDLGDAFSVGAFDSNGRQQVRYVRLKAFGQRYSDATAGQIDALQPGLSTRLGCALRHAGDELHRQPQRQKLLLVLTDGEPADIDADDPRYLTEDARHAVAGLRARGVDTFGVLINPEQTPAPFAERIFGPRRCLSIARIDELPRRLAMLFFRLSAR